MSGCVLVSSTVFVTDVFCCCLFFYPFVLFLHEFIGHIHWLNAQITNWMDTRIDFVFCILFLFSFHIVYFIICICLFCLCFVLFSVVFFILVLLCFVFGFFFCILILHLFCFVFLCFVFCVLHVPVKMVVDYVGWIGSG